jgi:luciferase family oxidoreductase group 1
VSDTTGANDKKITLSVVDQSPLRRGGTAAEALRESVDLARLADGLGYARYWVAEHHNTSTFAGTSPEILIGQIAARTTRIRVGSGGVMLTHYSALKVAEEFSVLNSFYPGRIDLGIGRAPGSDRLTSAALSDPRPEMDVEGFPGQITDLLGYLYGFTEPSHPFGSIRPLPGPTPEVHPEVWLLGSSDYSARLAAALGLPFAFAEFFGTSGDMGPKVAEIYRRLFKPSRLLSEPKLNVTLQVICAPTTEEALFVASSRQLMRADRYLGLGIGPGLQPPEEASEYPLTTDQRRYLAGMGQRAIDGDPATVRKGILKAAEEFGTTDIGIVTNCYRYEDRARSYELVAQALGISSGS